MELVLPLLALGGLFVISKNKTNKINKMQNELSNQENINLAESYQNMGRDVNSLPNFEQIAQNYPVENMIQTGTDTVRAYPNPNTATDKYFNQSGYESRVNNGEEVKRDPQQIYSMTGNWLESEQFKHNNMVPFLRKKPSGYTYNMNVAEGILDNMAGSGSQVIKKIEQAPLFKPEANMHFANGAPIQTDFLQSRVNPSMKANNVKPFDSIYVGPGINQGYNSLGSGGFNSGMESRNQWLPKTVDEMRVLTNPKISYDLSGFEGPADSHVKNIGILGRMEKQHPDTFYIQNQDRWLTTTGAEKGTALRPIQEMGIIRRDDGVSEYIGPAGAQDRKVGPAPISFEPSRRIQLTEKSTNHSNATGSRGPIDVLIPRDGYNNHITHRSLTNEPDTFRSNFSGAIGAVIAPLMDILRPSRKEELVENTRIYGTINDKSIGANYVSNPNDKLKTTMKETTLHSLPFYMNSQSNRDYVNNYVAPDLTQRNTTNESYIGASGGSGAQVGNMQYEAWTSNQQNNDIKASTIYNHSNEGNMNLFNGSINVSSLRNDENRFNYRVNSAASLVKATPSIENYGNISKNENTNSSLISSRLDNYVVSEFIKNPFTHPLNTCV